MISVSGVDGVSADTDSVFTSLSDQTLTISSGGILPDVCGYSPVPVS